jgi:hypothetical protein
MPAIERFLRRSEQMMVCRRRWQNRAMVLALGVTAGFWTANVSLGAAAGAAAVPTAADFEKADAKDLPSMRDAIIKPMSGMSALARDTYGAKVAADFTSAGLGVNSARQEVRLNSAILIHDLHTLSSEQPLILVLPSEDPAVRYWAARGLSDLAPDLMRVGGPPVDRVVKALGDRAKIEKSGIVEQEIVKALIQYGAFVPLLNALTAISNQMETAIPDLTLLQTASLDSVNKSIAGALAADKIKAATVAARLASFAAQQLKNNEKAIQSIDPTAKVPAEYVAAVQRVVEAATKVVGGAAGKTYPVPTGASVDELLLNVNGLFGTPGGRGGTLQADIPSVPVPPAVKATS